MKVCIGGTFNNLHKGHKCLIDKAFEIAGENGLVLIGLTKGDLLKTKNNLRTYAERKENLEGFLSSKNYLSRSIVKAITDKYGPSIEGDFDAIVVSPETTKTAEEINDIRRKKGKKPLKIIKIKFVLADDGNPISSTRVDNKEIDKEGNLLKKD